MRITCFALAFVHSCQVGVTRSARDLPVTTVKCLQGKVASCQWTIRRVLPTPAHNHLKIFSDLKIIGEKFYPFQHTVISVGLSVAATHRAEAYRADPKVKNVIIYLWCMINLCQCRVNTKQNVARIANAGSNADNSCNKQTNATII